MCLSPGKWPGLCVAPGQLPHEVQAGSYLSTVCQAREHGSIWPPRPFLLFQLSFDSKFIFFSRSVPFSHTINRFLLVSQFLSCIFNYIKRTRYVRDLSHIVASWRADWPYQPQTIKVPVSRSRIQFQLIFLEQDICGMESTAFSIVIC